MLVTPARVLRVRAAQSPQATERRFVPLLPDQDLILHDHTEPGRGRKQARRERVTRGTWRDTSRRSLTTPGGHKVFKRRPQADNLL